MPKRARVHNPFPNIVQLHQRRDLGRREHARQNERLNPHQRGYTREWRKVSRAFLQANPLCTGFDSHCEAQGKRVASSEVDHVVPHRGNLRLFWDQNNWQALCHTCHSSKTAREDGGFGRPVIHRGPATPGTLKHGHAILMGERPYHEPSDGVSSRVVGQPRATTAQPKNKPPPQPSKHLVAQSYLQSLRARPKGNGKGILRG